jgi:hypothetical protein
LATTDGRLAAAGGPWPPPGGGFRTPGRRGRASGAPALGFDRFLVVWHRCLSLDQVKADGWDDLQWLEFALPKKKS